MRSQETLGTMNSALYNERVKLIHEVLNRLYGDEEGVDKVLEVLREFDLVYTVNELLRWTWTTLIYLNQREV